MRPLRLLLDGFGSYRQPTEADFSDVNFFALTGPTGSGKSTLIDGLCFALYGTVPRWGKENVIAHALAPAASACRVGLVFEAGGRRYAAVRALARDKRGQVHTREARLDLLDPAVAPDAPLADLLGAAIEHLAEGPDPVKAKVQEVLGLGYDHFIQSVLLPQGRFADFLQAEPRKRQELLVELLAFGVFKKIGQQARDRARLAAERARLALEQRRGSPMPRRKPRNKPPPASGNREPSGKPSMTGCAPSASVPSKPARRPNKPTRCVPRPAGQPGHQGALQPGLDPGRPGNAGSPRRPAETPERRAGYRPPGERDQATRRSERSGPPAHPPERAHPADQQPQVPVREHLLEADHVSIPGIEPGADRGVALSQLRPGQGNAPRVE
jgi:hypothetical protein